MSMSRILWNLSVALLTIVLISTRDYEGLQDGANDTYGVKKSTVSRRFIKESSKNMNDFLNRRIDDDSYPA